MCEPHIQRRGFVLRPPSDCPPPPPDVLTLSDTPLAYRPSPSPRTTHATPHTHHTSQFIAEEKAGKLLQRGVFGTIPSHWLLRGAFSLPNFKNTANTNQVLWNNKLLALWEGGRPHEMDPLTLETVGETSLEGELTGRGYTTYSAHPRVDAKAMRMVNFGVDPAGRRAKLYVWEVDSRQRLLAKHTVPLLRRGTAAHDFLITVRLATLPPLRMCA